MKELVDRLKELRRKIQNCSGAAISPQCAALWKEYLDMIHSPEITAIRNDAADLLWRLWGYAFQIETAGFFGGPWGVAGAAGRAGGDYA